MRMSEGLLPSEGYVPESGCIALELHVTLGPRP